MNMAKYSMEAEIEASRLEEQVFHKNYSIQEELGRFRFAPRELVLDAGCGTGVLARYLVEKLGVQKVDAIDYSDLRLRQAQELTTGQTKRAITYSQQDLASLDPKFHAKYDTVICRYVIEHCGDPIQVLAELGKCLKKGGRLIVYELDGVFVNLYTQNPRLNEMMEEFKRGIRFDLHIGKKLPNYLRQIGLAEIGWEAQLISCQGERLEEERINTEKRFAALTTYLAEFFGSPARGEEFKRLYLDEMTKPENTLVFTKYICSGKKT